MAGNEKDAASMSKNLSSSPPEGSRERRRYIRTDTSVPMTLHIEDPNLKEKIHSNTRNISATGMMIEVDENLPVSREVKIDINTPDGSNPVHCSGKIIWSAPIADTDKYHCGIEFTDIEEDNKNTFLKFLCDIIYKASSR